MRVLKTSLVIGNYYLTRKEVVDICFKIEIVKPEDYL